MFLKEPVGRRASLTMKISKLSEISCKFCCQILISNLANITKLLTIQGHIFVNFAMRISTYFSIHTEYLLASRILWMLRRIFSPLYEVKWDHGVKSLLHILLEQILMRVGKKFIVKYKGLWWQNNTLKINAIIKIWVCSK